MTSNSTASAKPRSKTRRAKACQAADDAVAVEILQGSFASDADREEFVQAIKMHGVTFMYLSDAPLSRPSSHDLSTIDRLARSLSRFWPQSLVIGGGHG